MPETTPPTVPQNIVETLEMGRELGARKVELVSYIAVNRINDLWTDAVEEACAVTGKSNDFSFWDAPYAMGRVEYQLSLDEGEIHFAGTDPEHDFHSYSLPYKFLIPETREEAVEELREKFRNEAAKQRARQELAAAKQRRKDEESFEALGRKLGRL